MTELKDESDVLGLSNWKDGVAMKWAEEDSKQGNQNLDLLSVRHLLDLYKEAQSGS